MFKIKSYLSLVKFSHTIFAMPFAIIGYFMGIRQFNFSIDWIKFLLILLCMVFARNSAMAFNRYIDRNIDKKNPRTSKREIPQKIISPNNALIFIIINSILFIITCYFINNTVLFLSPIALFIILMYSYTKRFTFLSHVFLGFALSIAPTGAYIAVVETIDLQIITLSTSVLFWTAGFDIIYSLQDEIFDRKNHLFSIPAKFGRKTSLLISLLLHTISIYFLLYWTILQNSNFIIWIGFSIFVILLIYQHIIVKPKDISKINIAFGTTNGIASVCFALLTIISYLTTNIL